MAKATLVSIKYKQGDEVWQVKGDWNHTLDRHCYTPARQWIDSARVRDNVVEYGIGSSRDDVWIKAEDLFKTRKAAKKECMKRDRKELERRLADYLGAFKSARLYLSRKDIQQKELREHHARMIRQRKDTLESCARKVSDIQGLLKQLDADEKEWAAA